MPLLGWVAQVEAGASGVVAQLPDMRTCPWVCATSSSPSPAAAASPHPHLYLCPPERSSSSGSFCFYKHLAHGFVMEPECALALPQELLILPLSLRPALIAEGLVGANGRGTFGVVVPEHTDPFFYPHNYIGR